MPDTVILVGGYGLPDLTASATRAIGLAKLFHSIGLQVIVLGKITPEVPPLEGPTEIEVEGIRCVDVRRPFPGRNYARYDLSSETITSVVNSVGSQRVKAVILYNYPAIAALRVLMDIRRHRVPVVVEMADFYGWEGRRVLRNLYRIFESIIKKDVVCRLADNAIGVSEWSLARIPARNKAKITWVVDAKAAKWTPALPRTALSNGRRRFLYAGSPGLGMVKDRLPVALDGFGALHTAGIPFEFRIAGMTRDQYLAERPDDAGLVARLGDSLQFLGRIPHADSLAELRAADYALFFRRNDRVANTGFATKYVEAASLGIPVVTNPTSDIRLYLRDGYNGFVAPDISSGSIAGVLRRAATLGDAELLAMKSVCAASNPFDIPHWQAPARAFLDALRPVR